MRIKEWDYYLVLNEDFAGAFTLSDDGYIGLQSVSLLNFKEGWEHTETILNAFPMGKMQMPSDSRHGDIVYRDKRLHMEYTLEEGQRRIRCKFDNFYQGKTFRCDITLVQPKMDTMVIATQWKERKQHFIIIRRSIVCRQKVRWNMMEKYIDLIRVLILELWIGDAVYGLMIIAGTGVPAIR